MHRCFCCVAVFSFSSSLYALYRFVSCQVLNLALDFLVALSSNQVGSDAMCHVDQRFSLGSCLCLQECLFQLFQYFRQHWCSMYNIKVTPWLEAFFVSGRLWSFQRALFTICTGELSMLSVCFALSHC